MPRHPAIVARARARAPLHPQAHRIHTLDKTYDYIANVMKVLNSPGWASVTTDKLSLDDGENRFYVLIDEVRARCGELWRVATCRLILVMAVVW
jgi:hypothetical protein